MFVEVYGPLIFEFVRVRGLQTSDAADVTQEVLLRVAKSIRNFEYDREKGLFRDWLARVVLNEVRRNRTKKSPDAIDAEQLNLQAGDFEGDWAERFQQHVFDVALDRCRPHFAEQTWALFEASWINDQPAKEVAQQHEVNVDKVYLARSRVLKRLRYEVANLTDDIT